MADQNPGSRRYVIQRHSRGNDVHWDFMLEYGDLLRTWRIDVPPHDLLLSAAKATRIADHPLRFLNYEGPVNQNRGRVAMVDAGTYAIVTESSDRLKIRLEGKLLKGVFSMEDRGDSGWRFAAAGHP
ncbi:MAG: hypothetical protein IH624_11930 [Phycisphaerae bacterium]|nr:hypothetical protein [Phycisphaerae bacterium]